MSVTETGDKPRKKPGPKTGAEQAAAGDFSNTKYRPEFCEKVVEWGKQGKSKAWMCASLDIVPQTMADWEKMHPQFAESITRAIVHSQMWWEDKAQDNLSNPVFKGDIWSRNMAARFRNDWTETKNVNQTNEDGPAKTAAADERNKRLAELTERLGLAVAPVPSGAGETPTRTRQLPGLHRGN